MKPNVARIYWFLLIVSWSSSCLLFLLVASENVDRAEAPALVAVVPEEDNQTTPSPAVTGTVENSQEVHRDETLDSGKSLSDIENIESSFSEPPLKRPSDSQSAVDDFPATQVLADIASHNAGLVSDMTGTDPIVLTIVDTVTEELKKTADLLNLQTTVSTESQSVKGHPENVSHFIKDMPIVPIKHSTSNLSGSSGGLSVESAPKPIVDETKSTVIKAEPKVISSRVELEDVPPSSPKSVEADIQVKEEEGEKKLEPAEESIAASILENLSNEEKREDIPSFSEWTQKQLEEAEKKKDINMSVQNQSNGNGRLSSNLKLRSKNYASPDCGAKVIASNSEATSASAVISSSRDEYMLNTCTSRIWFVVELCEAVQAKKIELANFELFSSSPKDFTVFISDRFPTRDWLTIGQFTAKDLRDVQDFSLHPHLFGKYIKVELHSHYGSEHFCPISLVRVFGTSEFEVLETEDENSSSQLDVDDGADEFDEEIGEKGKNLPTNNLFGSARDAVISLVKKAAQVLVLTSDSTNRTAQRTVTCDVSNIAAKCLTPSHLIVCDNCSDFFFEQVYELLSCHSSTLKYSSEIPLVERTLLSSDICVQYGLNFNSRDSTTSLSSQGFYRAVSTFFRSEYIAALCNIMAIREKKVVLNTSNVLYLNNTTDAPGHAEDVFQNKNLIDTEFHTENDLVRNTEPLLELPLNIASVSINNEPPFPKTETENIQPTKTLNLEVKLDTVDDIIASSELEHSEPNPPIDTDNIAPNPQVLTSETKLESGKTSDLVVEDINGNISSKIENVAPSEVVRNGENAAEGLELGSEQIASLLSEWEQFPNPNPVVTTTVLPPSTTSLPQGQKESIFIRLFNRIKALERNMSLSSQYLEELSRRYKQQMEEMQKSFDKTIAVVKEESKKSEEHRLKSIRDWRQLESQISVLADAVQKIVAEQNSWSNAASWFIQFLIVQLSIVAILLYFCGKSENKIVDRGKGGGTEIVKVSIPKRRKSLDVIRRESPTKRRRRRPSEEALNISGTYNDLLIYDEVDADVAAPTRARDRRRKRKRNSILRMNSSSQNLPSECNGDLLRPFVEPILAFSTTDSHPGNCGDFAVQHHKRQFSAPVIKFPFEFESSLMGVKTPSSTLRNTVRVQEPQEQTRKVSKEQKIISPNYMKTATSERRKRISVTDSKEVIDLTPVSEPDVIPESNLKVTTVPDLTQNSMPTSTTNGLGRSDSLRSEESPSLKKDKKSATGLKKIFKKVF